MAIISKMIKLSKIYSRFFNSGSWGRRSIIAMKMSEKLVNSSSHNHMSTMNDLPSPEGSWQEDYDRKQVKNNSILFGSGLIMAGTIWIAKSIFPLQFNDPHFPLSMKDFQLNE